MQDTILLLDNPKKKECCGVFCFVFVLWFFGGVGLYCKKSHQESWFILSFYILWKAIDEAPTPTTAKI